MVGDVYEPLLKMPKIVVINTDLSDSILWILRVCPRCCTPYSAIAMIKELSSLYETVI